MQIKLKTYMYRKDQHVFHKQIISINHPRQVQIATAHQNFYCEGIFPKIYQLYHYLWSEVFFTSVPAVLCIFNLGVTARVSLLHHSGFPYSFTFHFLVGLTLK